MQVLLNHVNHVNPVDDSFAAQKWFTTKDQFPRISRISAPMENEMTDDDLTHIIIGCAYKVHNTLGPGFLEKVYENALRIELEKAGFRVKQQEPINVMYEGQIVGEYYADLWVNERVVVELRAALVLAKEHEVQLVNYLTATRVNDGLLINFGPSVQVKRKFREYKPKGSLMNAILPAS